MATTLKGYPNLKLALNQLPELEMEKIDEAEPITAFFSCYDYPEHRALDFLPTRVIAVGKNGAAQNTVLFVMFDQRSARAGRKIPGGIFPIPLKNFKNTAELRLQLKI